MYKLIIFFLFLAFNCLGQNKTGVSVVDFVKIKNGRIPETIYYYENNWKIYRAAALEKNYITSYKILKTVPDSVADFDLILFTEYADSVQYNLGEERFGRIIKELRPDGPIFLNEWKANDFRQILFNKRSEILIDSRFE